MRRGVKRWVIWLAVPVIVAAAWSISSRPDRARPPETGSAVTAQGAEPSGAAGEAGPEKDQPAPAEGAPCPEGEVVELMPGILPPDQFRVVKVERQTPQARLELVGEVEYNRNRVCRISPPVSGKVVKILHHQGEFVDAGGILQILDSAEMGRAKADHLIARDEHALAEAEHARQKLLYKSKEQILGQVEAGITAEEALRLMREVPLGDRKSLILTAVSEVEHAQREEERARLLFEQKIGAQKKLFHAQKELTEARIRLAAILEDTSIEARQLLLNAEMAEHMKRAALERTREELLLLGLTAEQIREIGREPEGRKSMVPIIAPFAGRLVEQYVSLGEIVDPSTYLYRLADLSVVWVRADVYEEDLSLVWPGKEVSITVPAYPGRRFRGTIVHISSEVDQEKRTVAARIEIDNSKGELKPGMFCTASVDVGSSEGPRPPLVVPTSAVHDIDGTPVVFVPCGENRFAAVAVSTGEEADGWVAITSGLRDGDQVVAEGSFILKSDLMKGSFRKGYED